VVLGLSAGCNPTLKPNPVAEQLGTTTQTTERYHVLGERPFEIMLGWDRYVVALEKITKEIAHPPFFTMFVTFVAAPITAFVERLEGQDS
jgi:hypothetical protein